jgi:NAD(P)-dependent dehydrogenase (short-subunit alcohol dehydrogenase family)
MVTALVTGGNRGIGRAAVRQLAAQGYKVWLGARDAARGRQAEADLRADGLDVTFLSLDVADAGSVKAAAETVAGETPVLDALINNAAISRERDERTGPPYAPSALPMANLKETFDTNFFGAVAVTKAFLPLIRRSPAGRIVNVSSGLGSFAFNTDASTDQAALNILGYKTSKAALNMATILFAQELKGTPIKVNAASPSSPIPGPVATDLSGPGRGEALARQGFGTAEQGAETVVHLATLPADGPTGVFWDLNAGGVFPW